ncbi:MAG: glycosyltransferase family 2 protein, partial [Caulobacteraceae bacterium]
MSELVSIVIPAYNAARWIGYAVDSALQQTHQHVEVIVVDDGSSDETASTLRAFGSAITVVSASNKGPSSARNLGTSIARGLWIQYLDADDMLHPQKMEFALKAAQEIDQAEYVWFQHAHAAEAPPVPAAYTHRHRFDDSRRDVSTSGLEASYTPWAAMFRRSFLDRVGPWNEGIRGWEDLEFHVRIAEETERYARVHIPMHSYRQHAGSRLSKTDGTPRQIDAALSCVTAARASLRGRKISSSMARQFFWPFYVHLAK